MPLVHLIRHLAVAEYGQDAAEYAVLIALIAIVIVTAVTLMGTNLSVLFSSIAFEFGQLP